MLEEAKVLEGIKENEELEENSKIIQIEELIPESTKIEVIQMVPIFEDHSDNNSVAPMDQPTDQSFGIGNLEDVISSVTKNSPKEKVSKKPTLKDADLIYTLVEKFGIEEVNIENLQKLHECEFINVPFFQGLRKLFDPKMIKSHIMEVLGIRRSYTGFHEFIRSERDDLPSVGICSIAKTVGYNVLTLPIPDNISDEDFAVLMNYQTQFLMEVEKKIGPGKIPATKMKKTLKEKPKDVNVEFLNNLHGDIPDFSLNSNVISKESDQYVGENETYDDDLGKVDTYTIEENNLINGMSIAELDSLNNLNNLNNFDSNLDKIAMDSIPNIPNMESLQFCKFEDDFDYQNMGRGFTMGYDANKVENFNDLKFNDNFKVDMSGFSDSFENDFGNVITEELLFKKEK
jgi:hypothetical protein